MLTIEIHDEQLAQRLREIAEQENRPVEDVLKQLVSRYEPVSNADNDKEHDPQWSDTVMRIQRKVFARARKYWASVGDEAKAKLSDEVLDEAFAWFDQYNIPRLKAELPSLEPSEGTLAYAAKLAEEANIRSVRPTDAERADEILNEEFADYLLYRRWGIDITEPHSRE